MNIDAERYLFDILRNEGLNNIVNIRNILPDMRSKFNVSDKQVYATLFKWSRRGIIDYGVSINVPWLCKDAEFYREE